MFSAEVEPAWSFEAWRALARAGWCAQVEPDDVAWNGGAQGGLLMGQGLLAMPAVVPPPRVSADFMQLAASVLCHRDPQRHAVLYRLLWRVASGEKALLERATDVDVHRLRQWQKAVQRDTHKMKALVRFRRLPGEEEDFMSWFEPEHWIVDRVAPFFARRFAGMRWAILTPYRSVRWDGQALTFGEGAVRTQVPADDAQETLWRTYYAHIFNPARLNPTMMRQEMPQKYWKNLPEATLLPELIRDAGMRVREMAERAPEPVRRRVPAAPAPLPEAATQSLAQLRTAARDCRRCELWQPATQTVFGEGSDDASVMVIGEQPGDEEDLSGRPFVGPAGRLFNMALGELGVDRETFYVTNAVKHFRFEQRGKRRLHRNPERTHVQACSGWLQAERAHLRPAQIVCLGATAAQAVLGSRFRLMQQRGQWQRLDDGTPVLTTVHPSWVLRQPSTDAREEGYRGFVEDLRQLLDPPPPSSDQSR
ncbi:UdgX family uracil-DNA binding protein [Xanthomonas citri pv. citri]|uniref:UdgX family uracil-DNA binding protein n=1 Tax=Xanthomonas citri TaxID=346 RepID=UPI00052B8DA8|nr:UdgX family uracil-DNA binding protein [Xanthomonas citri]MBD3967397.1 UdgX family uracil-DNA binding protein [Xanthomonas citri pv. citri]MBD3974236.1 UdgX family uracil-DNA binding protein [Xanthomonas citri pv. citri]MBD3978184.1 UdgX family uracil-DNA binding protein [Xanthomonas citri pv. citri]MBD3991704.1 UdgX family uracil-DNA binding protein [Xanthomonas citri pv. citri]MBD4032195.1 UdgX family uracil-DNA binding protein [Xanthomonas citri pv. citri]